MKRISILACLLLTTFGTFAQKQLSTSELNDIYTTSVGSTVSIHDPSVVYRNGSYTVWGSHLGVAQSTDLVKWTPLTASNSTFRKLASQGATTGTACTYAEAFNTQQVTRVKNYKGVEVELPNFDAEAYAARYAKDKDSWINGDMWAPDIIYNETMGKWCMYLSINGDYWASIIILLTADKATGPFTYQGPVVMGGFTGQTYTKTYDDGTSAKIAAVGVSETDLAIATGETTLPTRYKQTDNGKFWPNCIDPCVFFDEDGELWMTYGSWSGGIFILKLDKQTGLRDYTYTYESDYATLGASGISDPYFGKKIAGGYYVSGEGSYIQRIGNYYYLFMSYGGFAPDGGYEMRIFRSEKPDGPYKDASGATATYTSYQLNYGPNAGTNRGAKLMGSYNEWGGIQDVGELAQGHNSACTDAQGRSFVVYHTKFGDGTLGHQVRVHQLFTNEKGWLVAAPFNYQGETTTDADIATSCPWTREELVGEYQMLIHPYKMDHANYQQIVPSKATLTADGKVSGDLTGTWGITNGTAYMNIKVGTTTYYGVFCPQHINGATTANYKTTTLNAIAFTAQSATGVSLWGYKLEPESAIAWNYKQNTIPVKEGQTVSSNLSLMFPTDNNTTLTWTSSEPDVISETGKFCPRPTSTPVTLTARLSCGDNCYWEQSFNVTASKEIIPSGDYLSGLVAYYNFDEKPTYNQYKASTATSYDKVTYSTTSVPTLVEDYERFGKVMHQNFGAQGSNSYSRMPNPLLDAANLQGFTVSAWVRRTDANQWDAIWSFFNSTSASASNSARLYLTGNSYLGFNDNAGTWFDINYPTDEGYTDIPVDKWTLVTMTAGPANGIRIYINGVNKTAHTVKASDGSATAKALPYADVISKIATLKYFYLGSGSFWGSADCYIDDLMIYNRELSSSDVRALNSMVNRVCDFTVGENGTAIQTVQGPTPSTRGTWHGFYDLSGRRIQQPTHGIYIKDGQKYIAR